MELTQVSLDELMSMARNVRDVAHGTRITFSPKVFIPLTMLCRDRCGYCTFAQPPARLQAPYLTPEQVLRHPVSSIYNCEEMDVSINKDKTKHEIPSL